MSDFLTSLIAVVGVLGFMILIHEFGHYAVAKWLGVRVEQFAIGFGKRLIGFRKGETDYRINAIPLGGYVKMSGENPMLASNDANIMADSSMTGFGRGGRGGGRGAQQQAKPDGKGFPRGPGAQIPGFGRPVNLQGLPQVVGLALGAPEFQRR